VIFPFKFPCSCFWILFRREWHQPEALQFEDNSRSAEKYPGGDGNFKEQGPNTKYNWKQDRVDFQRMPPLTIAPPEKRGKSCVEREIEQQFTEEQDDMVEERDKIKKGRSDNSVRDE
jgi:hypothetical protein